eukprot:2778117-Pyramimonas_sp.AAC.1
MRTGHWRASMAACFGLTQMMTSARTQLRVASPVAVAIRCPRRSFGKNPRAQAAFSIGSIAFAL